MTVRLPSYEPCANSPKIGDGFQGITMAVPEAVDLAKESALPVYGAFQLADELAVKVPGGDPFRAIVLLLIATPGYHPFASNVAGQAILLEPSGGPKGQFRGYFNVDAFQLTRIRPQPGVFYISVYLDSFQSASVPVVVSGKLPDRHVH